MAVAGERRLAPNRGASGAAGEASASLFAGNDEILTWLDVLLKGKPEQQAIARTEIAMILEARGFADDAEEAYWTNVQAGAADRRSYERLIAMYQLRRDRLSETLVRRQLDEVFSKPAPTPPAPAAPSGSARAHDAPVSLARHLTGPNRPAQPAPPVRRLRGARRADDDAAPAGSPPLGRRAAEPEDNAASADHRLRSLPAPATQHRESAGRQAVPVTEVLPAAASSPERTGEHRRARLAPNPHPSYRRYRMTGGGLIALQPTTIMAFVLASVGVAAMIVFFLVFSDRGIGTRLALTGSNQLPARCADATRRFPGATDPRGSVASAYRQQGVDVDAPRVGGARLSADQAELVIGGWMAASLLLENAGQTPPKLNEWLDPASSHPTLANAIVAGRRLDTMVTADEWAEIQSWPATTCGGAFMHDPRNTSLIGLMERVVAR
jgi:hypothetical protein